LVLGGYDLAPYLDILVGYQWTTYRDASVRYGMSEGDGAEPNASERNVALDDFAEGSVTVSVGVSLDYRLADIVLLGMSAAFTHAFAGLYGREIAVSATASYIWF
jgi:hypothetical protein